MRSGYGTEQRSCTQEKIVPSWKCWSLGWMVDLDKSGGVFRTGTLKWESELPTGNDPVNMGLSCAAYKGQVHIFTSRTRSLILHKAACCN